MANRNVKKVIAIVGVIAMSVAAAVIGSAVASAPDDVTYPDTVPAAEHQEMPTQARTPARGTDLADTFAVLREASSNTERPLPTKAAPSPAADVSQATLATRLPYGNVWAVPEGQNRDRGLCVEVVDPTDPAAGGGYTCAAANVASRAGVLLVEECYDPLQPSSVRVTGLAPDGVGSVTAARDGESVAAANVSRNAFSLEIPAGADELEIGTSKHTIPPVVC